MNKFIKVLLLSFCFSNLFAQDSYWAKNSIDSAATSNVLKAGNNINGEIRYDWVGGRWVTLDSNGRVVKLAIEHAFPAKEHYIHDDLGKLTELNQLIINGIFLDSLPDVFQNLSKLQEIYLGLNPISFPEPKIIIPKSFGDLISLKKLEIRLAYSAKLILPDSIVNINPETAVISYLDFCNNTAKVIEWYWKYMTPLQQESVLQDRDSSCTTLNLKPINTVNKLQGWSKVRTPQGYKITLPTTKDLTSITFTKVNGEVLKTIAPNQIVNNEYQTDFKGKVVVYMLVRYVDKMETLRL